MYVDESKSQGKYKRYLLRESYRDKGKVRHRTIANLARCSSEEIEAIRLALKHKEDLPRLLAATESVSLEQGLSVGGVWLVYDMARQLGIADALGNSREGKLALWQVIARVMDQGSRLSAVRLAGSHAVCDIVGLEGFDEDDLYGNLDWLAGHQSRIEDRLFGRLRGESQGGLFLYDVTSSYLEGQCNELGAFGYNRDGKKSKKQIVIGLLCNGEGKPLSIEVFTGNTTDTKTFGAQVRKVADRFGGGEVTLVGDRGMIRNKQVEDLPEGFHYITAITKPQIETLLKQGIIQMSLFDQELAEVESSEGIRYVLRRNPQRVGEVEASRQSKLARLRTKAQEATRYLKEHPLAREDVALRKITEMCEKLKLSGWVKLAASERRIELAVDPGSLGEVSKLDGCYVLKTDLSLKTASKEIIHDRYKDLALVEWAFRTSKTVELEMRPIHVRKAERTRAHAFVVMLGYRIVQELAQRWCKIDLTVEEGIQQASQLCATELRVNGKARCNRIPQPRQSVRNLFDAAKVTLPEVLPCSGIRVATRKKLTENRKER